MSKTPRGKSLADMMSTLDDETLADSPAPAPRAGLVSAGSDVVAVNVLVTPADRRRLRQLSLDAGLSLQKLGHEAWNLLLKQRGLEPLESVSANVPSGRRRRET